LRIDFKGAVWADGFVKRFAFGAHYSGVSKRILQSLACATFLAAAPMLAADMHWGPITRKACALFGLREWSGVLWDIPRGESWRDACRRTPAIAGGRGPDACVVNVYMWGSWYVPDRGCLQNPRDGASRLRRPSEK